MIVYILTAFIPVFATGYYQHKNMPFERKKKGVITWCSVALLLLLSLRSMVVGSGDGVNYTNRWIYMSALDFSSFWEYAAASRTENGFELWQWIFSHLFSHPQMQFFWNGLLLVLCIAYFMYRNCDDLLLGYTMYICLGLLGFMMQGMRQAVAMAICLLSIEFVKQRKLAKFVLTVFIAGLFHQTSICFLILYFFYGKEINVKTASLIVLAGIVLYAFNGIIINVANVLFDRTYTSNVESGGYVAVMVYIAILLLSMVCTPKLREDKDFAFFFFMTSFGCMTYIIRYVGVQAAERISYYFMFGQIMLLPKALTNLTRKSYPIVYFTVWMLCLLLFIYRMRTSLLTPYIFFWQV